MIYFLFKGMRSVTKTETTRKLILKLVKKKKVSFSEGTVDNEHMNKKKSKICCIYHSNNEYREKNKYER
jgi:protein phosphatase 1 regulatory subunit 11